MKRTSLSLFVFRTGLILAALAGVTVSSGCLVVAAGAAGAGTVAYIRGELDASLPNSLEAVARASDRAMQQLQFAKISERKDALAAQLIGRTAMDKKIEIHLDKAADNMTRVRIRVGVFGDENISRTLLDKIKDNL